MYEIFLKNSAEKSLKGLNGKIAKKITTALKYLKNSPMPAEEYDFQKVSGKNNVYRLRISKYRIVYEIDWKNKTIIIIKIGKKGETTYSF